jgi:hypothetical protein
MIKAKSRGKTAAMVVPILETPGLNPLKRRRVKEPRDTTKKND